MDCASVTFSGHAVRRMFQRAISQPDILHVIRNGQVIEDYPNDAPYPSCLVLGFVGSLPIHTVVAKDASTGECIVVTVYAPDPKQWSADYKTRRTP